MDQSSELLVRALEASETRIVDAVKEVKQQVSEQNSRIRKNEVAIGRMWLLWVITGGVLTMGIPMVVGYWLK